MAKQALEWTAINLDKSPAVSKAFQAERKAVAHTTETVQKLVAKAKGVSEAQVKVGRRFDYATATYVLSYAIDTKAKASTTPSAGETLA